MSPRWPGAGFVVARGLIDAELRDRLFRAVAALLRKYSPEIDDELGGWDDPSFHRAMLELRRADPSAFGLVYDSTSVSAALQGLAASPPVLDAAGAILGDPAWLASTGLVVRMDPPNDDRNALRWHQEHSYYDQNGVGDHGLVCWFPLNTHTVAHGPVEVCPGSHLAGHLTPVTSGGGALRSEQYEVPDDAVARFEATPVLLEPGDAVLFHMELFHRSGENRTRGLFRFSGSVRFHLMPVDDFVPGRLSYVPTS